MTLTFASYQDFHHSSGLLFPLHGICASSQRLAYMDFLFVCGGRFPCSTVASVPNALVCGRHATFGHDQLGLTGVTHSALRCRSLFALVT
jgi:hypothetical protein